MKKYIYIITNNINKKVYIGQTNDPKRREREHFSFGYIKDEKEVKILYSAMIKYGIESFNFSIIEGPLENYNDREKFWIKYYNSLIPNGYNMTEGGENPPVFYGEDHPMCVYLKKEIEQIQKQLKENKKSISEIAKEFNYSTSSINRINQGQLWYDEKLIYPIRVERTKQFKQQRMESIVQDLLYTNLTQKQIAEKYSISRTTVTAINRGQNFRQNNIDYPIRKKDQHSKAIAMIDIKTGETIEEFLSASEAIKKLFLPDRADSNIRACANGKIKSAYGYIWKFIN